MSHKLPHEHSHGSPHAYSHSGNTSDSAHGYTHVYFSDVHAGRDSQFFGAPHDTPDTQTTAAARAGLALDPDNFDLLIELAEALNFQLR